MRKNQPFSTKVRFYTKIEPCSTIKINEVCVWADAFDCVCVCRGADGRTPLPHSVSPAGDSDSPVSSRPVKENWVLRHKWQQRGGGIHQRRLEMQLPLNYQNYDKSGDCRKEKNTGEPIPGLLFIVTEICYRLCSFAQHWQCLWSRKIKSHLCLIFLNLAAYETEAAWESAHVFISCGNGEMLRFVCGSFVDACVFVSQH